MPLAELEVYQGRNPRPDDFDAFWTRALAELDSTPPNPELTPHQHPATFASCFDLWFTGVGGARVHAQYIRPHLPGRRPAIVRFHGYTWSAGDWIDKLAWAAQGFAVAAMDVRGQGGLSRDAGGDSGTTLGGHIVRGLGDHPDKLLFRQIFLDTVQLVRVLSGFPEIDSGRMGAMGGSQGGGLTLACSALAPQIVLAAPVFPFLSDYRRVWEMDLAKDAYEGLTYYFTRFDPRHEREEEIFRNLGYIDVQHLADRIKAKVMMGTALMDMICPPSTQFAAYNKIASEKRMVLYPDFGHDDLPGHPDLVFEFMSELL
jgi:cephalosporin-C deacetylase